MKITIINKSDSVGGAAVVSLRLMRALRDLGQDARMLVVDKRSGDRYVHTVGSGWRCRIPFLAERAQIYLANGRNRADLFKADTGGFGLPLHRDPLVAEADVVVLGWVNQGMLSLAEIERISALGKPIVWIGHDMWTCTGICHHAGECEGYLGECGLCPLLGRKASAGDLSHKVWGRKMKMNGRVGPTYVAVSRWLQGRMQESSLLKGQRVECIPNAVPAMPYCPRPKGEGIRIIMAAARLDDPIKGLDILRRAVGLLTERERITLTLVGNVKNPASLEGFAVTTETPGTLGMEELCALYSRAHIVVSSSLYETLPGTLIEGMAHGALPVAFDRGGQADIITDGETGALLPFTADPAESLASGLLRAMEMVKGEDALSLQRRLVEEVEKRFSARAVAGRYLELFESLARKS